MKIIRMLLRSFRDAYKSIIRNISLSLTSLVSITITLLLLGTFLTLSFNVNNFTNMIKQDVSIVVFLNNQVTEDEAKAIYEDIGRMPDTTEVVFVSKEEVKEQMASESEIFGVIMSEWKEGENPLHDTVTVKVTEVELIPPIADAIRNIEGVEIVEYGAGVINNFINLFRMIERVGYGAIIALLVVTAFLIANTIKLTIYARQDEIGIMRLVGASNTSIRLPFVIEGLFLGFLGSIIPIVTIVYGYTSIYNAFGGQLFSPMIKLISPEPFVYTISLYILGLGVLIGMFGSSRAVRRYLKI
jgi:cell division transport system permease protein